MNYQSQNQHIIQCLRLLEFSKPSAYKLLRENGKLVIFSIKSIISPNNIKFKKVDLEKCSIGFESNHQKIYKNSNKLILIVGHAYGRPGTNYGTISANLIKFLDKNHKKFKMIIFTGDVLSYPSEKRWNNFIEYINKKSQSFIIAPGNHDTGSKKENTKRDIFKKTFIWDFPLKIKMNKKYFLVEDTTMDPWKLSKKIFKLIEDIGSQPQSNLHIFAHHVLRPNPEEIANSLEDKPSNLPNYFFILNKYTNKFNNIFIFSGDTGAFPNKPRSECLKKNNLFFISQGLGNLDNDEIIFLHENKIFKTNLNFEF